MLISKALFTGISTYEPDSGLPNLVQAFRDASILKDFFSAFEPCIQVKVLGPSLKRNDFIKEFISWAQLVEDSRMGLIYLSAHSTVEKEGPMIWTSDTKKDSIRLTGVKLDDMFDVLRGFENKSFLILFDSCRINGLNYPHVKLPINVDIIYSIENGISRQEVYDNPKYSFSSLLINVLAEENKLGRLWDITPSSLIHLCDGLVGDENFSELLSPHGYTKDNQKIFKNLSLNDDYDKQLVYSFRRLSRCILISDTVRNEELEAAFLQEYSKWKSEFSDLNISSKSLNNRLSIVIENLKLSDFEYLIRALVSFLCYSFTSIEFEREGINKLSITKQLIENFNGSVSPEGYVLCAIDSKTYWMQITDIGIRISIRNKYGRIEPIDDSIGELKRIATLL